MGKASRARSARQAVNELKREKEQALLAQKKKKTITNIIIAAVSVLLCAVFVATIVLINAAKTNGSLLRSKSAMKTDNFEISGTTFTYFLNYQYADFVNNNSSNLSNYGLDVSVSLRDQEYNDGKTWFDYMATQTEDNLTEILRLAEKAKADGVELGKTEKKQLEDFFKDLEKSAKDSKLSVEEYVAASYGQGVNVDDIKKGLEISMLATKYYDEKIDSVTYSDKEIQEYFEANSVDFLTVDYKYYKFTPTITEDMTDKEADAEHAKVKKNAERLLKATTPEEFDSILTEILKEDGVTDTNIKTAISNTVLTGNTYDEKFDISKWAFSADTKLNATRQYVNGNSFAVYMVTKLPYRNEETTRSVRHILISLESYKTDDEAKKKAEAVLDEYNKGDKTAESFGKLAEKYTEDSSSAATGGLYEKFTKGEMVKEFEDWSFDENRKVGDTGIVKTTYGYHIMYFVEKSKPIWKDNVILTLKDKAYDTLYKELEKKYTVEFDNKILASIPLIKFSSSVNNQ